MVKLERVGSDDAAGYQRQRGPDPGTERALVAKREAIAELDPLTDTPTSCCPAADARGARSALRVHLGDPWADHDDIGVGTGWRTVSLGPEPLLETAGSTHEHIPRRATGEVCQRVMHARDDDQRVSGAAHTAIHSHLLGVTTQSSSPVGSSRRGRVESASRSILTIVPWVTVKPANSLLPRADQEPMAAEIPGARLVIYADVGHLPGIEAPERRCRPLPALLTCGA